MKKNLALVFGICTFLWVSCNDDDDSNNLVIGPPSSFIIEVTPSFTAADINWSIPEGENNQGLTYDVFLDDILQVENHETNSYELSSLEQASTYVVRIVAKNQTNETSEQIQFDTLLLPPSSFIIDVTPSVNAAEINWSIPEGVNNQGLTYDVFLDDNLQVENHETNSYELSSLELTTTYILRVVAKNEIGEASEEIQFTTLDSSFASIRIENYTSVSGTLTDTFYYIYNDEGLVSEMGFDDPLGESFYFQYNQEGQITQQRVNAYTLYKTIDLEYENGEISSVLIRVANEWNYTITEYYTSIDNPESFTFYEREIDWNAGQLGGAVLSEISYQINQVLDSEGRITSFQSIQSDTGEQVSFEFEYDGNNISQVIENGDVGNIWEVFYDDKNYFNKNIKSYKISNSSPSLPVSSFVKGHLKFMPHMINLTQERNYIEIRQGGTLISTRNYEYNEFDYPILLTVPNQSGSSIVFNYTIE